MHVRFIVPEEAQNTIQRNTYHITSNTSECTSISLHVSTKHRIQDKDSPGLKLINEEVAICLIQTQASWQTGIATKQIHRTGKHFCSHLWGWVTLKHKEFRFFVDF